VCVCVRVCDMHAARTTRRLMSRCQELLPVMSWSRALVQSPTISGCMVSGQWSVSDQWSVHATYYQWVPLVLLMQALLSAGPHVLWSFASRRAGLNMSAIIDTAHSYQKAMYAEPRDHALRYLVAQVTHSACSPVH